MPNRSQQPARVILTGIAAGLLAGVATGLADRRVERLVSEEHKRREKLVRQDSAHKMAGPFFARKLLGHELSGEERRRARATFGVAYGVMWGLIHAAARTRFPILRRFLGLPFAVPFFFACDGGIAPLLGISPAIRKLPWQINAKEMANHVVWTVTAESVHRLAAPDRAERS